MRNKSTKGIAVDGQVILFRAEWTVEKALREIRNRHGLQNGGIEEDGVVVSGDEVIGDLAGTLVFVGGQPFVPQIGATAASAWTGATAGGASAGYTGAVGDWNINTSPVRVLGDDISGPHSSAIIIGRRTIVACAHSLDLVVDDSHRNTKSNCRYKHLEDYWIQPHFTRNVRGEITDDNRIQIKLFKFHPDNDWALFVRADDALFDESEIATIDTSPIDHPDRVLAFKNTAILHCPVSLKSGITRAEAFSVGCQITFAHLQGQSSHHVKYEGRDLCRGSSGGGVYVYPSTSVLGIHTQAINEADYNAEDVVPTIGPSDKIVRSESVPYKSFELSEPPKKRMKSDDSETLASVAGGNNGLGSALILCKFPRLMHYIRKLEAEVS